MTDIDRIYRAAVTARAQRDELVRLRSEAERTYRALLEHEEAAQQRCQRFARALSALAIGQWFDADVREFIDATPATLVEKLGL